MNINELTNIYQIYLKRKPTIFDIEAHIKKDKSSFINEILNCTEYATLLSIYPTQNTNLLKNLNIIKLDSGYGKIFMHNSLLHYTSQNNIYFNISLSCPSYLENKWLSILALTNDNKVISNSNTFYWEYADNTSCWKVIGKDNKIYDRLVYTYHYIKNSKIKIFIKEECFLLANPFTCTNAGHELSIILDALYYIKDKNIDKIVVFGYAHKYPGNLNILKLFIDINKILFIDFNTVYYFNKIHIIKQTLHDIFKHPNIIEEVKKKIIGKYQNIAKYKNKKIIMIKNSRNVQVVRTFDQFICEELFRELDKRGYININPEIMNIYEIVLYLMHAKTIISSHGSILYTHQIFFGKGALIYIMCLKGTDMHNLYYDNILKRTKELVYLDSRDLDGNIRVTEMLLSKFL